MKSNITQEKSSFYLFSIVTNPVKLRITKSRKILDKQDKIYFRKTNTEFWLAKPVTFNSSYIPYGINFHELNREQRLIKQRQYFLKVRRQLLNHVTTGINFSTVDNESKNDNFNAYT